MYTSEDSGRVAQRPDILTSEHIADQGAQRAPTFKQGATARAGACLREGRRSVQMVKKLSHQKLRRSRRFSPLDLRSVRAHQENEAQQHALRGAVRGHELAQPPVDATGDSYDYISCQFASHYVAGSEARMAAFLDNIAALMAKTPGARASLTFPDPEVLLRRFKERGKYSGGKIKFGNSVYECAFPASDADRAAAAIRSEASLVGIRYDFSLGGGEGVAALDNCREYVMPVAKIAEMAAMRGMCIVRYQNFGDFFNDRVEAAGEDALPSLCGMKVKGPGSRALSSDEWEAVTLYRVCVLAWTPQGSETT